MNRPSPPMTNVLPKEQTVKKGTKRSTEKGAPNQNQSPKVVIEEEERGIYSPMYVEENSPSKRRTYTHTILHHSHGYLQRSRRSGGTFERALIADRVGHRFEARLLPGIPFELKSLSSLLYAYPNSSEAQQLLKPARCRRQGRSVAFLHARSTGDHTRNIGRLLLVVVCEPGQSSRDSAAAEIPEPRDMAARPIKSDMCEEAAPPFRPLSSHASYKSDQNCLSRSIADALAAIPDRIYR